MAFFPLFNNALLSTCDIERATPCRLFCEAVNQMIFCDTEMGRLFAEDVYHYRAHSHVRDEFRRKLTSIVDFTLNRSYTYMKSDHLHVLSPGQTIWLQSRYDRWITNNAAIHRAHQNHLNRRFFKNSKEITAKELITFDVADQIEKYSYPPFNFMRRVGKRAAKKLSKAEKLLYNIKVKQLQRKRMMGRKVPKKGPGLLPVSMQMDIKLFYEKRSDSLEDMDQIFADPK